jgi:pimeloyl-ACP methyl ester carboxylesterase
MKGPIAVLVHGAGHTAEVWRATREAMRSPSLATDLPGRGARPADITMVTVSAAANAVVEDVLATIDGEIDRGLVLIGHSVSGTILPSVAARLGPHIRHLVFVAGITAPEGVPPLDVFLPGQGDAVRGRLAELRREHAGQTLEALDVKTASSIDSLNFASQPMRWHGLPTATPRTFVRCLRDPIQPRELQAQFIANCDASAVVDIDAGHTPALDTPVVFAAELDRIVDAVR